MSAAWSSTSRGEVPVGDQLGDAAKYGAGRGQTTSGSAAQHPDLGEADLTVALPVADPYTDTSTVGTIGDTMARFRRTQSRALALPATMLTGKRILVTGGTGCIGTELIRQLLICNADEITSISRGVARPRARWEGVRYATGDVRNPSQMRQLVGEVRPDLIYHLAAVREPAIAERAPARAVSTNIGGTHNMLAAARESEVPAVACASTGKALRFWTPDVYATTKKITEYLVGAAAASSGADMRAVRFTHVVDNSIISRRLHGWARSGEPVRLHSTQNAFYVQSAQEAAQLLVRSIDLSGSARATILAQRDLGWPIELMDLAQDIVAYYGNGSSIETVGHEPGYEAGLHPGTYGMSSLERSPLFNIAELSTSDGTGAAAYDSYDVPLERDADMDQQINRIIEVANRRERSADLKHLLGLVGEADLRRRARHFGADVLQAVIDAGQHQPAPSAAHALIDDVLRRQLGRT